MCSLRYYLEYRAGHVRYLVSYDTLAERDKVAAELLMHGGTVKTFAKPMLH